MPQYVQPQASVSSLGCNPQTGIDQRTDESDLKYKEGDQGKFILRAETTDKLLIFTSNGRFYTLGIDKLPGGRGHGDPLRLMIDLEASHDIIEMRIARATDLKEQRLLVVSSRQPYIHEIVEGELRYIAPRGGVTTAMDPIMQECRGTWVTYGEAKGDWYAVDDKNSIMVPPDAPAYTLRLVWLAEEEE